MKITARFAERQYTTGEITIKFNDPPPPPNYNFDINYEAPANGNGGIYTTESDDGGNTIRVYTYPSSTISGWAPIIVTPLDDTTTDTYTYSISVNPAGALSLVSSNSPTLASFSVEYGSDIGVVIVVTSSKGNFSQNSNLIKIVGPPPAPE